MKAIRKKLFLGLGVAVAGVVLIIVLASALFLGNHSVEYREFSKKHAGELERVRLMLATPVPVSTTGQAAQPAASTAAPAALVLSGHASKVTAREITEAAHQLSDEEWQNINIRSTWDFGAVLPAEGAGARLSLDEALRRRIREEILYRGLGTVNLLDATTVTTRTWVRGEAPLTTRTAAVLDQTEAFLSGDDWGIPEFQRYRITDPNLTYLNWSLPCAALLRWGRAGDANRVASLAEGYLAYLGACRVFEFPFPYFGASVRRYVLCDVSGAPGEAALVRIDAALRRGRWSARQLADLRAAHVMRLRELWQFEDAAPQGRQTRIQRSMEAIARAGFSALVVAAQRPTALAWAGGSASEVYQSLPVGAPVIGRFWADGLNMFPPELAARQAEPPVNLELDLTRLAVAAARYRLAGGAYPKRLDELIPRYLEADWRAGEKSCWVIDTLEEGIYPDLKNGDDRFRAAVSGYFEKHGALPREAEALRPWAANDAELKCFGKFFGTVAARPVFYQARRVTLPRECAPAVRYAEGWFLAGGLYDNNYDWAYNYERPGSPTERVLLRRLGEGRGDTEVWVVRGFVLLR